MTPQQRADKVATIMWEQDDASKSAGLKLVSVQPGSAQVTLLVEQRHANGHGICHGGYTFTLADTAFAFACNSYNQFAVAQHNTITYLKAASIGDELTASAREVYRVSRSGVYDVTVTNQLTEIVAVFRGHSRTIRGQFFTE